MCLAIYKPPSVIIPEDNLHKGWTRNPDGGGFAWHDGKKLHVQRGFDKFKEFLSAYNETFEANRSSKFLIHFRIRSTGDRSKENCHPHTFAHGVAIHNGTISGTGADMSKGKSDTVLFLEKFGKNLTLDRVRNNLKTLDEVMSWNKMVFLYNNGDHIIVNEKQGTWRGGAWYSNNYSFPTSNSAGSFCGWD